ncbi:MAG: adenosylmethionine--8-amino-7-oxononanoate transaminase [Candidatus Dormibacteria bacterium]
MSRRLIGVTGTDTGVGKTVVTVALTAALHARGHQVDAIKVVETGVPPGTDGADATALGRVTARAPSQCVLETYALPRSPRAAAAAEGTRVDVRRLVQSAAARADAAHDGLLLEGVGGLLVPLDERHTVADVFRRLGARVLIVARAGLGTINHTALTVAEARAHGLDMVGVVLNNSDEDDAAFVGENAAQIAEQCGVPVLGILPRIDDVDDHASLAAATVRSLDLDAIVACIEPIDDRAAVLQADAAHVWHPFTQTREWLDDDPPVIRRGDGAWLIDEDGRHYLDGVASLWANVHGHAHPTLDRAAREQLGRIAHSTFLGQTHAEGALLARDLARVTPGELNRIFYSEAGAAAVEVALRIALLAQQRWGKAQRTRFLSLDDAYHGDTAGAVSIGRSEPFHTGLDPLLFDVVRTPAPHHAGGDEAMRHLQATLDEHGHALAAFIVEPRMQGAAGMLPHSDQWLRDAVTRARDAGLLVICDEVATGFGRTGDLFASPGADGEPDVLVLGKGLSGGYLPLSATIVGERVYELFTGPYTEHRTLYYGHTYSGNPLACAVARASLGLFASEHTIERARALSLTLATRLQTTAALPCVHEVRQRGVMIGVELRHTSGAPFEPAWRIGRQVTLAARRRGVIVRPLGDVVVMNPPLCLSDDEATLLVETVSESIAEVCAQAAP